MLWHEVVLFFPSAFVLSINSFQIYHCINFIACQRWPSPCSPAMFPSWFIQFHLVFITRQYLLYTSKTRATRRSNQRCLFPGPMFFSFDHFQQQISRVEVCHSAFLQAPCLLTGWIYKGILSSSSKKTVCCSVSPPCFDRSLRRSCQRTSWTEMVKK